MSDIEHTSLDQLPPEIRAAFERRGSAELVPPPRPWRKGDESKHPPSARGSVTVRRPDGTTITCDVAQLQEVLEQVHKVRPRTMEVTCTAADRPCTFAEVADEHVAASAARAAEAQGYRAATTDAPGVHLTNATHLDAQGVARYTDGPNAGMSVNSEADWSYG